MSRDMPADALVNGLTDLPNLRHSRVAMNLLDEATGDYWRMPGPVADAQRRFAAACTAYANGERTTRITKLHPAPAKRRLVDRIFGSEPAAPELPDLDALWDGVIVAGAALADQLRPLGEFRFPRCGRPMGENNYCNSVRGPDGECNNGFGHSDGGPGRPYRGMLQPRYAIVRDFPDGRDVTYTGDDPAGFADQVRDEFGFDPATQPEFGVWVALDETFGGFWAYRFRCPAQHYNAICGRWPVSDASPIEPDDEWTASGGTIAPDLD